MLISIVWISLKRTLPVVEVSLHRSASRFWFFRPAHSGNKHFTLSCSSTSQLDDARLTVEDENMKKWQVKAWDLLYTPQAHSYNTRKNQGMHLPCKLRQMLEKNRELGKLIVIQVLTSLNPNTIGMGSACGFCSLKMWPFSDYGENTHFFLS